MQVIGATTFAEYRKYIEKDSALERRFQPVKVEEPSLLDTIEVIKGIRIYYEKHHCVRVPDAIVTSIVKLSERYITDRFLPDKAIDLLDEACACCNLRHPEITELLEPSALWPDWRPASTNWRTPKGRMPPLTTRHWPLSRPIWRSSAKSCPPCS